MEKISMELAEINVEISYDESIDNAKVVVEYQGVTHTMYVPDFKELEFIKFVDVQSLADDMSARLISENTIITDVVQEQLNELLRQVLENQNAFNKYTVDELFIHLIDKANIEGLGSNDMQMFNSSIHKDDKQLASIIQTIIDENRYYEIVPEEDSYSKMRKVYIEQYGLDFDTVYHFEEIDFDTVQEIILNDSTYTTLEYQGKYYTMVIYN